MAEKPNSGDKEHDGHPRAAMMFALLLLICVLLRLVPWSFYEPFIAPDTATYARLADQIAQWDFADYNGTRTPGYPLLMLVAGRSPRTIWLIQTILGIGTSALVYLLLYRHSASPTLALAGGLLYSISLNLLFFEAALLTEPVSTFLIVLSLWLFSLAIWGPRRRIAALGLGLVAGVLGLTHPLFAFSGLLFGFCTLVFAKEDRLVLASLVAFVAVAPLLAWMTLNKQALGVFTITTFTGFNLTNHSGGFMELAPPSQIRDIYLEYREIKRAETGRHSMTIYLAREEIQRRTGLSTPELSSELTRISLELFREHPVRYLRSVAEQWVGFWTVPSYWRPNLFTSEPARRALMALWTYEHVLLRALNVVFLLLSAPLLALSRHGAKAPSHVKLFGTVVLFVLSTSLVQALFEFGNTRYSIPTQAIVGCTVLFYAHRFWLRWTGRTDTEPPTGNAPALRRGRDASRAAPSTSATMCRARGGES